MSGLKACRLALFGNIMDTPKTELDVCFSHEIECVRNGDSIKSVRNGDSTESVWNWGSMESVRLASFV